MPKEKRVRAIITLETFLKNVERKNGFFVHFANMNDGKREWNSEVSIIDTDVFLMGALTVEEYFGEEAKELFEQIYGRVDFFRSIRTVRRTCSAWGTATNGDLWGHWDTYVDNSHFKK